MSENQKKRFYLPVLSISLTALLAFALLYWGLGFLILERQQKVLYDEKVKVGRIAVDHFVNNALALLLEDDTLGLNVLLKQTGSIPSLAYAFISDEKGLIRAHTDPARIGTSVEGIANPESRTIEGDAVYETFRTAQGQRMVSISRPVTFLRETVAYARAGFSLDRIDAEIAKERAVTLRTLLALGIAMLAVFACALVLLVLSVRGSSVRRVSQAGLGEADEDGIVEASEDAATAPDSFLTLTCSEETKRNQVSVLFVGVKGFKAYAENRDPEALMEDLNEYLSIATSSVEEFGGFVDKLVGDGVISIFANSAAAVDHAERAMGAALAMQARFKERGATGNSLLPRAGIGISSGVVLSGCVGTGKTKEVTFLGESFRTAYSLTVMASPGEIILSKESYRLLEDIISVEPLPPREMLQRTHSWENFRVLGRL